MISIVERIPAMSDQELANLRDNAERLAASGTPKQIAATGAVLTTVAAEIAMRKERHKAALAAGRAARSRVAAVTT